MDPTYLVHEFLRLEEAADFLGLPPQGVVRLLLEDRALHGIVMSPSGHTAPFRVGNLAIRTVMPDGSVVDKNTKAVFGAIAFSLDQLLHAKAWLAQRGHKVVHLGNPSLKEANNETPEQRRNRRLSEFYELGGMIQRIGDSYRNTGFRGAFAKLSDAEKARGSPQSSTQDVRKEVIRAWDDAQRQLNR